MTETNPFYGSTFAERKASRERNTKAPKAKAEPKQVDKDADEVEDKAVTSAPKKRAAKKS